MQIGQGGTHDEQKEAIIDFLLAPVMVKEQLLDSNTTMKVFDVCKDALHAGIKDKEIVSMIALFGIQSNATRSQIPATCSTVRISPSEIEVSSSLAL